MNHLPLASRDFKKLHSIAHAIFEGLEGIDLSHKHKLIELFCQISGYRNLHDVQSELKKGEPEMPIPGSISLYDLQLVLTHGLLRVYETLSESNYRLNIIEAFSRVMRSDLEPLSVFKSTVEHLHTQLHLAKVDTSLIPAISRAAARRQAENELCWTPEYEQVIACGGFRYQIAITYDDAREPYNAAVVHHWHSAVGLYKAIQTAKSDRHMPSDFKHQHLSEPEYRQQVLNHAVVHGSYLNIEYFVTWFRIPYHEIIWLFSGEGEYIGRALRHTVHGAIVNGLMHTDEDVTEGKCRLLLNIALTDIHNRYYDLDDFKDKHIVSRIHRVLIDIDPDAIDNGLMHTDEDVIEGKCYPLCDFSHFYDTLPVYILKQESQVPKSVASIQDRPFVDVKELVRLPNITAGYALMSNQGGSRSEEKVWHLNGRSIGVNPIYSSTRDIHYVSYLETECWLDESDLPTLFPNPKNANNYRHEFMSHPKYPTSFLPRVATDFHDEAMYHMDSELDYYVTRLAEPQISDELLSRLTADPELSESLQQQSEILLRGMLDLGDANLRARMQTARKMWITHEPRYKQFGTLVLWHAWQLSGARKASFKDIPIAIAYLAAINKVNCQIQAVSMEVLPVAIGRWLDGKIRLEEVPAVYACINADRQKLAVQEERISAVRAFIMEHDTSWCRADGEEPIYRYSPVPETKPEDLLV